MTDPLPRGWTKATLSDIVEINPRHPRELNDSLPVSFATMAALSESRAEFQFLAERPLGEVRKGFTHFAEGDVLFAKITPCMENGKAAVAVGLRNGVGCGTTELHVLRPLGKVDPHYKKLTLTISTTLSTSDPLGVRQKQTSPVLQDKPVYPQGSSRKPVSRSLPSTNSSALWQSWRSCWIRWTRAKSG
jgi:hypothetical protein